MSFMDYMRTNKYTKRYILPPKGVNAAGFENEVVAVAKTKISELDNRLVDIADVHRKKFAHINKFEFKEITFLHLLYEYEYQLESYYINKWWDYWNSYLIPKRNINKKNGISDKDIELAKNYPTQKLYDGNLRCSGNRFIGLCVFHQERHPSLTFFEDGHYYCFGCSEHGTAIDFLMKTKNLSFKETIKELTK